ncbi:uncharacterized protein LOC118199481 [Stegodyphus dumicola]|uniref:uncharacterized protein LOC118199481 n=1 Tax=Stegodyphus dumicola TaxID=202533 RepID=UPI0015AC3CD2|nr:uncharacterized protein LOC118199481 [Stegodyphus dumicola]
MFRFFSKRFGKSSQNIKKSQCDENARYSKNIIPCKVILLDGSILSVEVSRFPEWTGLKTTSCAASSAEVLPSNCHNFMQHRMASTASFRPKNARRKSLLSSQLERTLIFNFLVRDIINFIASALSA